MIHPEGIVKDVIISADSREYLADFLVLHPKTRLGGHSLIMGRPWLDMDDAFISYILGLMPISDKNSMKNLVLYPPSKPIAENESPLWVKFEPEEGDSLPLLTIGKDVCFKDEIKYDKISSFINIPPSITQPMSRILNAITDEPNQENPLNELLVELIPIALNPKIIPIEIEMDKTLNINPNLTT